MRRLLTLVSLSTVLALSAPSARAMTVQDAPVEVVMAEADLSIHATVVAARYERVPGPGARVRTRLLLAVWEVLAPTADGEAPGAWVEILLPGGIRDGLQTSVPGVPRLRPGDEVILLLSHTPWGYQPIGYALGTFFVAADGTVQPAWAPHTTRARQAAATLRLEPWLDLLRGSAR